MATINGKTFLFPADIAGTTRALKAHCSDEVRKVTLSETEKGVLRLIALGQNNEAALAKRVLAKAGAAA